MQLMTDSSFRHAWFQIPSNLCQLSYESIKEFQDAPCSQEAGAEANGSRTVARFPSLYQPRIYSGGNIMTLDPLGVGLLHFLRASRRYEEVETEYNRLNEAAEQKYYPLPRILRGYLQRGFIRATDIPQDPVPLVVFQPTTVAEGVFRLPDMLTFIDEGAHFQEAPFLIHNPRAGRMNWMDRPGYELARFILPGRTFSEIADFFYSGFGGVAAGTKDTGVLFDKYLKPMLDCNLLLFVDKRWKDIHARPNIFVSHPPIQSYKITPRGFPPNIALIPTLRCDNACRHCSANAGAEKEDTPELDFPMICRLLDEMHYNGLKVLRITGGEPLMRADIFDILDYAAGKYFGLVLYTNGNRIHQDNIARMAAISARKEGNFLIHLSLDGGPQGHNWFRRNAHAYERVVNTMRLFQERSIQYYIEMCVHPQMLEEFEQVAELTVELGARALLMHPALGIGRGQRNEPEFHLGVTEIAALWKRVQAFKERFPQYDIRFSSFELASAVFAPDAGQGAAGKAKATRPDYRPTMDHCTGGLAQCVIDSHGNVYPCPSWTSVGVEPAGNVLTRSLADIWRDPQAWTMSRGGWDYSEIPVCSQCRHLGTCELGKLCRIPSILWFGTPYGPPPSCILHYREVGLDSDVIKKFRASVAPASDEYGWDAVPDSTSTTPMSA